VGAEDCTGAEELLEDDELLLEVELLELEELLELDDDELLELDEPLEPETGAEVAPPLPRLSPASIEHFGQAPGPCPASVRWATEIWADLLARSARGA